MWRLNTWFSFNQIIRTELFFLFFPRARDVGFCRGSWNRVHLRSELRGTLVRSYIYNSMVSARTSIATARCTYLGLYSLFGTWTYLGLFWSVQRSVEQTRAMVICIYERSTCRYVGLNSLNILHVPRPCFIAPFLHANNQTNIFKFF